ncbi:hypothetical protein HDV05_001778, partial [Chytridiales sp. JEL 0842]
MSNSQQHHHATTTLSFQNAVNESKEATFYSKFKKEQEEKKAAEAALARVRGGGKLKDSHAATQMSSNATSSSFNGLTLGGTHYGPLHSTNASNAKQPKWGSSNNGPLMMNATQAAAHAVLSAGKQRRLMHAAQAYGHPTVGSTGQGSNGYLGVVGKNAGGNNGNVGGANKKLPLLSFGHQGTITSTEKAYLMLSEGKYGNGNVKYGYPGKEQLTLPSLINDSKGQNKSSFSTSTGGVTLPHLKGNAKGYGGEHWGA